MFENIGLQELWIDFGTGKAHRHIPVYTIVQNLGPDFVCLATVSSPFLGIGKKTA